MSRRVDRVEKELRQIVAGYLLKDLKGLPLGVLTVSRVEATSDLKTAKVFVSFMGNDEKKAVYIKELQSQAIDIQREISKQLRMKFIPKLRFCVDESLERAEKVEQILKELKLKEDL